ncbi:RDD family protein [Lusitaniella coriacea LEGE 07157]|uniref:RDD family protein n=1 Tax=Lusitaniella coriacea LEGE 07157 TaxID=945747 RepID=A0A8J7J9M3_9CYAN|nr:RDD family protein [Lusitaniella coriacea]MBE9116335.1 RDD family protein [Lusitaniella coriacea LEGE 07157]
MGLFNRINLQTPESVELEFTLAGIGNRTLALLIDNVIWGLILLSFLAIGAVVSTQLQEIWLNFFEDDESLLLWIISIQILIFFSIYMGYFVFFETLWQGQTPGKRAVKIRVIRDNGRSARLPQATLRSLLRPIDDLFFLGVFFIIFGKQEKRLGDWIAGTLVVQEEKPVVSTDFALSQEAKTLAEQLLVQADLSQLLPEDFAVIREYLRRRSMMLTEARTEKSKQLAQQVKKLINLEKVPKGITANHFLEAVYLAYQRDRATD